MNQFIIFALVALLAAPAVAQDEDTAAPASAEVEVAEGIGPLDAADVTLEEFLWINRPVVVFADTPADPRFQEQVELLLARTADLVERDVVIITDTDPAARSDIRTKLRPRGFQLALIGKDGGVKLRKPSPWDVRELSRVIDKMPLRQREMRERLNSQ
ncbi:Methylmalonyl-CoA epimerase [Candidatus Rhodobacter oscarellae]|uniref:Methylmalonyl-CoA epimerase n=1 Tax=Candidatus Rhodobacter oscarellae TaxID=1675527 RepID=A0A0J9GRM1_9RHOB|nr:DUF4174 domain-containing protein [Candidatus Rhodobacter lobularis]KMW56118.1 Methylmalonyl-CoA epimerase [Candidatus Rhodobacter lobularis]